MTPEGLDKGANLVAVTLCHNLSVNLIARLEPPIPICRKGPLVRQAQASIQGHPTHELGVEKVLLPTSHFPDAFVFFIPMVADPLQELAQVLPEIGINGTAVFVEQIAGSDAGPDPRLA